MSDTSSFPVISPLPKWPTHSAQPPSTSSSNKKKMRKGKKERKKKVQKSLVESLSSLFPHSPLQHGRLVGTVCDCGGGMPLFLLSLSLVLPLIRPLRISHYHFLLLRFSAFEVILFASLLNFRS
jgi:hypothetical protein